jgi:hypothetical protein
VADGVHVIVLHPGLDLATTLGCGTIPTASVLAPVAATASPYTASPVPVAMPSAVIAASPQAESACIGVIEWAEATNARLDELDALADDANEVAGRFDLPAYVAAIEAFAVAVQAASAAQASQAVPDPAAAANGQVLVAYGRLLESASLFQRYYTVEMSFDTYALATSTYEEALGLVAGVRRETGRLIGGCASP